MVQARKADSCCVSPACALTSSIHVVYTHMWVAPVSCINLWLIPEWHAESGSPVSLWRFRNPCCRPAKRQWDLPRACQGQRARMPPFPCPGPALSVYRVWLKSKAASYTHHWGREPLGSRHPTPAGTAPACTGTRGAPRAGPARHKAARAWQQQKPQAALARSSGAISVLLPMCKLLSAGDVCVPGNAREVVCNKKTHSL